MSEREQTPAAKEKDVSEGRDRTIPTFLPAAREGGNEDVLRLMRAL